MEDRNGDFAEDQNERVMPIDTGASKNAREMAMVCHLAAFACFVGIPLGNILGPLVVWLIKREEIPEVDLAGREALNFQISATLAGIAVSVLAFIGFLTIPLLGLGFLILLVAILLGLVVIFGTIVYTVIAAIESNKGVPYRYPYSYRFL